jgi:ABC-type molybdate transport system substrate-binding protein
MKAHKSMLSLVLGLCFGAIPTRAQEIAVAAAADLKFAMGEVAGQYEKQAGNRVNVSYGSSENFFSQLQNGAPFDLFFSADIDYARKLETAGLAEPGTLYRYAIGRIVIWAPADSKVDVPHWVGRHYSVGACRKFRSQIQNTRHTGERLSPR